jgi:hypothetical protein
VTATPLDFPSVRAGIAAVLNTIPELLRVNPYDPGTVEAANNMPFATLRRGLISTVPVSIYGEGSGTEGLGQESHEVEWVIRIYAQMAGVIDAQEKDDLFASRLVAAFDANRIIDPNGPGVTRLSRLGRIEPFEEVEATRAVWVTVAYLTTIIDSSIA